MDRNVTSTIAAGVRRRIDPHPTGVGGRQPPPRGRARATRAATERSCAQLELVTDELRKQVGQTFTLARARRRLPGRRPLGARHRRGARAVTRLAARPLRSSSRRRSTRTSAARSTTCSDELARRPQARAADRGAPIRATGSPAWPRRRSSSAPASPRRGAPRQPDAGSHADVGDARSIPDGPGCKNR